MFNKLKKIIGVCDYFDIDYQDRLQMIYKLLIAPSNYDFADRNLEVERLKNFMEGL